MQNYWHSVWSVLSKGRAIERVYGSVEPIWNWKMLTSKVSIAGRQSRNFIDPFFATYFDEGKIIQDQLDRLGNNSLLGNVIATIINFAAALLKSAVAVECFYHIRPYYWIILRIFFYPVCVMGRGISTIFLVMVAVLKWIVIMSLRLTSSIFVGLTTIFVCVFSWLIPAVLLALNGVLHVAELLTTPVRGLAIVSRADDWKHFLQLCFLFGVILVVTVVVLWGRSANRGHSSSRDAVFSDSPVSSSRWLVPYCWQYKESDSYQWNNFGHVDNVAIEKLFCDVENVQVNLVLKGTSSLRGLNLSSGKVTVNFEHMSMQIDSSAQFLLHRCSTPSYIQEPENVLSTKWVWYWKDDDGWKKYAKTKQSPGTKQEDIEAAYLNKDIFYFFRIRAFHYIIVFYETSMYQQNMDENYLTKRSVRRRPLFVSEPVLETTQSDLKGEEVDFERIIVKFDSREFQTVYKRFHLTIPESKASIKMVCKIKNDFLLERYNRKREQMKKKLKASNHDEIEKLLFHGTTPDVIDAICKQNFDHRMRGKNGTVYGQGSYFAVKASYSNNYSNQSGEETRFMFLASVLTGEYKLGGGKLLRPPLKDPNNPASDLYDSCVDNEEEPKIFVIFNDEQCYPSYLIEYCLQ